MHTVHSIGVDGKKRCIGVMFGFHRASEAALAEARKPGVREAWVHKPGVGTVFTSDPNIYYAAPPALPARLLYKSETKRVFNSTRSKGARGPAERLYFEGWIPPQVKLNEQDRRCVEWIDAAGRHCTARPHGKTDWVVRWRLLPAERAAARAKAREELWLDQFRRRIGRQVRS